MSNILGALQKGGKSTPDLGNEPVRPLREIPKTIDSIARPSHVSVVGSPETDAHPSIREVRLRVSAEAPLLPFANHHQRAAEQYHMIRTKILHHFLAPQFVLISSATSGDGKTVTAINVAASFALKPESCVLLIDGDLRQPRVARALGIPEQPGLSDVLAGREQLDQALVRSLEVPNLFVLAAGEYSLRAADLLDSECWRGLAVSLRSRFTTIICDAPPIASVADYELLQLAADGVVMVARPGHTERYAYQKALASIEPAKLIGVVLNGVEDWWLWKTPQYGYYAKRPPAADRS